MVHPRSFAALACALLLALASSTSAATSELAEACLGMETAILKIGQLRQQLRAAAGTSACVAQGCSY